MDEEYLYKLTNHTPYSGDSLAFIEFLIRTLYDNYQNENYHFASFALHQIYMTVNYMTVYQIFLLFPDRYNDALIMMTRHSETRKKLIEPHSPFDFAELGESECFHLLEIIGLDDSYQGQCKALVKDRNLMAHAKGNIRFEDSQELFLTEIDKYILLLDQVRSKTQPHLLEHINKILTQYIDNDTEIEDLKTYIETSLMQELYLSHADVLKSAKYKFDNAAINESFKILVESAR